MKSIISYPSRGNWGNSQWRGNCSGHVIKDLIEHFSPRLFVDICEGSGTSREVCQDLNVPYQGFDLHSGFDFTKKSVRDHLEVPADLCFSHPPYHNIIEYSGKVWGKTQVNGDLSLCSLQEEFLEKSQIMLLNQREATDNRGIYSTLIGDIRGKKAGGFRSLQADFINLMPKNELISVVIKTQHNCVSDSRIYRGNFIPFLHEYLLIWKAKGAPLFQVIWEVSSSIKKQIAFTWRSAIRMALMKLGGPSTLQDIYAEVEKVGERLIKNNKNWKAKIRQQLQFHFTNVERGVWAI